MRILKAIIFVVASSLVLGSPRSAVAQANDDCFSCHSEKGLTKKRAGKTVSLFVDQKKFEATVHGKQFCVGCHADLKGKELPHDETLKPATCRSCHPVETGQHENSLHGKAIARGDELAPRCINCHGKHEILAVKDPRSPVQPSRVPYLCGQCHSEGSRVQRQRTIHQSNILTNYTESIHGDALMNKGLVVTATCVSCHTAHSILPHTDAKSSIARANIAATCSRCHASIEAVHRKVIQGKLWEREAHVLPACPDCHEPHKARRVFYDQGMADRDCLRCHERRDLKASKDGRSLYVDSLVMSGSKHAKQACSQCHTGVTPSRLRPCETITQKVNCASCHAEIGQQYALSTHGQLEARKDPNGPSCKQCHGTHDVLGKTDPRSSSFPTRVPTLCARCHRTGKKAALAYIGTQTQIVERYTESIHGKGLIESGLVVTATCTSCHTAHSVLPRDSTLSSVNRNNLPKTCGNCHDGIAKLFESSVHSALITKTDKKLPVCDDCHSAHTISRTDEAGFKLRIMSQCGSCHVEITKSYFETYHGKVSRLGYTKTAQCYDCHGSHDILRVTDPRSHLSRDNVVATCKKCHAGASRRFAGYLTHATHHDFNKYPVLFWVFWAMTTLLVVTFTVGGAHTLMWLPRALKMRREFGRHPPAVEGEFEFERFSRLNRVLHVAMIVSFISLALTGMTLKFSYTKWASVISHLLGGFETAGYIHRLAAVIMVGVFVAHITDVIQRKRRENIPWMNLLLGPKSMMLGPKDLADFIGSLKWFVGRGKRPSYGRWTYWEKFDYFAVFWGIAVIGSTGLSLWFPTFFARFLPGWFVNVATIIHSDEALLATGFIFTIHFFNTHLRPEKFPMDIVVFTGRMTVEELKHDKPEEYEELVASGTLEDHLVVPYQPIVIRAIRAFAWTALAMGFMMVLWIVYAMLFAYV
ncbi:MAG TPA: cytochrome c3 family protein [Gemmatimonadaceae bacterium]